jgi:hypothetical protein
VKSEPSPPMTLGGTAAAGVRLIVWCVVIRSDTACRVPEMRPSGRTRSRPTSTGGVDATTYKESSNRECNYFSTFPIFPLSLTIFWLYGLYEHDERNNNTME